MQQQPAPINTENNNNNSAAVGENASLNTSTTSPLQKLTGLPAVEYINKSASTALKNPSLSPEQATTLERALNDARLILSREAEGTQPWLQAEAAVLNNLGCLLRRINRLAEAVQYLQHAVYLEQKANGKPSVPTLLNLSAACNAHGDTQKAVDAALSCMSQYATLPSSLRAITLHNLAMCDYHVNQPQVRERVTLLLERAYTEAINGFGTDHVTTETIYRHLSALTGESSSRNADLAARAMRPLSLAASAPSLARTIDEGPTSYQATAALLDQENNNKQQQQNVMEGAKFSNNNNTQTGAPGSSSLDKLETTGMSDKEAKLLQRRIQEDADAVRAAAAAEEEQKAREELEKARQLASEAEARRIQKQKEVEAQKERERKHAIRTQYRRGMDTEVGPKTFMRFSNYGNGNGIMSSSFSSLPPSRSGINSQQKNSRDIPSSAGTARTSDSAGTATPNINNNNLNNKKSNNNDSSDQEINNNNYFDVDPEAPPAPLSFSHVREQFRAITERERNSRNATFLNDDQQEDQEEESDEKNALNMTMHTLRKHQREATSHLPRFRNSTTNSNSRTNKNSTSGGQQEGGEGNEEEDSRATHSIFRETARKRREKFLRELAEDQEYEKETAIRRLKERQERERENRFAALRHRVETRAANVIQHHWRRYQAECLTHMALTNKAMRQNEDMRRARRVVRFARKWLQKSQGRILLCRLRVRYEKDFVYVAVRRVQCAWRCFAAKKKCGLIRQENQTLYNERAAFEKRYLAATQIQMWYRITTCKNAFEKARHDIKAIAATKIQRWIRRAMTRERAAAAEALRRAKENSSATKIQSAWRGFQARVFASMERIKVKMHRMKMKERVAAERMQRIGRGLIWRKRLATLRADELFALGVQAAKLRSATLQQARSQYNDTLLLQQQQQEQERIEQENKKALLLHKPRPPTPSRERVLAAQKFLDENRQMALDALQERMDEERVRQFQRPTVSQYDKMWAVEQLARTRDFSYKRRNSCAIVLQRWWRLYRRPVLENHRSLYEAKSAARKIAYFDDKFKREKLREQNDLAKPIRDMKQELQKEIDQEYQDAADENNNNNNNNNDNNNNADDLHHQISSSPKTSATATSTVETTNGKSNNIFQEWHTKPRGDGEKFVQSQKLKAARKGVREEERLQQDLVFRSTRVTM